MRPVRRMRQYKAGQGREAAKQHLHIDELQRKPAPESQRAARNAAASFLSHAARHHAPGQPENIERARPDQPGGQPRQHAPQNERRAAAEQHDGQKTGADARQQGNAAAQAVRRGTAQSQDVIGTRRHGGDQRVVQEGTEGNEGHDILLAFYQHSVDSSIGIANIFAFILR